MTIDNNFLKTIHEQAWSEYIPCEYNLHGWFTNDNIQVLNKAFTKKPEIFVELGVWYGKSSEYILNNCNCTLISIDVWEQDAWWYKEHGVYDMVQKYPLHKTFLSNFYEFKDKLIPIKKNDIEAIKELHNNNVKVDAFYLDTTHEYNDTINEIETIMSLYPNAFLCGDDYTHHGAHAGCGRAIDEMALKYNKKLTHFNRGWYFE